MPRKTKSPIEKAVDKLPPSIQGCTSGWQAIDFTTTQYVVQTEEEFYEASLSETLRSSVSHLSRSVASCLSTDGKDPTSSVAAFRLLLSDLALQKIVSYTNQALVKDDLLPTTIEEYLRFLGHKYLAFQNKISTRTSWDHYMQLHAKEYRFELMELSRFKELLSHTRGFEVEGRDGDDDNDNWLEQNFKLGELHDLEQELFKPSVRCLLNKKDGCLVIDDELLASRAGDVELKTVSERKSGKDGPVADCIADSTTGILLGMRLREKLVLQQTNVTRLLECIPNVNPAEHSLRICFDRGYGKLPFIKTVAAKNCTVSTIAATQGSQHPFIEKDDFEKWNHDKWVKDVKDSAVSDEVMTIITPFVIDSGDMLGSEVMIASKEVSLENGKKVVVVASAVRDAFDRKTSSKDLRFFCSGKVLQQVGNAWVAQRKKEAVPSNTLFSAKKASYTRNRTEQILLQYCRPLTVGQRCADWFLMKSFRITGTMASKLSGIVKETGGTVSDELKQKLMDDLLKSWFGRHRGTAEMAQGTNNESPTVAKLIQYEWIYKYFEVGLLEWREASYVGVSPDGIVLITKKEQPNPTKVAVHTACVEIKTRTVATTIQKAEEAAVDHGTVVYCDYGDTVFRDCVPSENRKQVLHQAVVTGCTHGLFVTAKVEDGIGSLVQCVIIDIPRTDREEHRSVLLTIGMELVGWLHGYVDDELESSDGSCSDDGSSRAFRRKKDINGGKEQTEQDANNDEENNTVGTGPNQSGLNQTEQKEQSKQEDDSDVTLLGRGYTIPSDFPNWIRSDQAKVIESRFRLWCGVFYKIAGESGTEEYKPCYPVNTYKHAHQYYYNKGKWGLDKNTECTKQLGINSTPSFESKYVLRMIDGIMFNHWRYEQSRTLINPFLLSSKKSKAPLHQQIRSKATELSLADHVYLFSLKLLQRLEMSKAVQLPFIAARPLDVQLPPLSEADNRVINVLKKKESSSTRKWPLERYRVETFVKDPGLAELRTHQSVHVRHTHDYLDLEEKDIRKKKSGNCAICNQRRTLFWCVICKVPLCTRNKPGEKGTSHFDRWHNASDLVQESKNATKEVAHYKSGRKRRSILPLGRPPKRGRHKSLTRTTLDGEVISDERSENDRDNKEKSENDLDNGDDDQEQVLASVDEAEEEQEQVLTNVEEADGRLRSNETEDAAGNTQSEVSVYKRITRNMKAAETDNVSRRVTRSTRVAEKDKTVNSTTTRQQLKKRVATARTTKQHNKK